MHRRCTDVPRLQPGPPPSHHLPSPGATNSIQPTSAELAAWGAGQPAFHLQITKSLGITFIQAKLIHLSARCLLPHHQRAEVSGDTQPCLSVNAWTLRSTSPPLATAAGGPIGMGCWFLGCCSQEELLQCKVLEQKHRHVWSGAWSCVLQVQSSLLWTKDLGQKTFSKCK